MNIIQRPSPNYEDRHGWKPDIIVYHITEGSASSAVSWFQNPASEVSTHFVVSKAGEIYQCVDIKNTAYGNVTSTNPSYNSYYGKSEIKAIRERKTSANFYTVSIEHEGIYSQTGGKLTDAQLKATTELTVYIIKEIKRIYGIDIPVDREHLIGHYQTNKVDKINCPGRLFQWDELIAGVKKLMGQTSTATTPTATPSTPATVKSPVDLLAPYMGQGGAFFNKWYYGYANDDDHCAMTVSWAYTQAGVPLKQGWVDNIKAFFVNKGAWHKRGDGYKPKKNDVIIFDYEPNGVGNHVGLVRSSDSVNVNTREGNTGSDGINRDRTYALSDWRIMGYGEWEKVAPKVATAPAPTSPVVAREIDVPAGTKGYVSVDALKADKQGDTLEAGKYYIYKQYEDYLNVSKKNGIPGHWVKIAQPVTKYMRVYEVTEKQVGVYAVPENAENKKKELEAQGKKAIIREDK